MTTGSKEFLSGEVAGLEELVKVYVEALRAMIEALPTDIATDEPSMGSRQEIMLLLARAQVTWLTSGLRYWKQIAEIVGNSGLGLLEIATRPKPADMDDDSRRTMQQIVLIDRARAMLREVGEASISEAEALRAELTSIEADLRATMDPGKGPEGKRYGRAKP